MKPPYWDRASAHLSSSDRVLGGLVARYPDVHLAEARRAVHGTRACDRRPADFGEGRAVDLGSLRRAATGGKGDPVQLDPGRVGRTRMTTLRRVGLSESKAIYLRDLARHFVSGALDPREWPSLDDEALIERLVDVKGIGRWTAEMFLIFHELRPDIFPVDDIGLQKAVALHYHDGARMTARPSCARSAHGGRPVAAWPRGTCGARSIRFRSSIDRAGRACAYAAHERESAPERAARREVQ